MANIIQNIAEANITDSVIQKVREAIDVFKDYNINLSEENKQSVRSMAEGREGYVRLTSRIANQHPESLSRRDKPEELNERLHYYDRLENTRIALLTLLENIQETQLAVSTDIMTLVDRYVKVMQIERNNDSSLDLAMREVDNWNKRFSRKDRNNAEEPPITIPDLPINELG